MSNDTKSWVWWATEESRAAGQVSVQAVAETVLAVGFYWWLAQWWDSYALMVVPPFIAIVVLLRCPLSVDEGVRLFQVYLDPAPNKGGRKSVSLEETYGYAYALVALFLIVIIASLGFSRVVNWVVSHPFYTVIGLWSLRSIFIFAVSGLAFSDMIAQFDMEQDRSKRRWQVLSAVMSAPFFPFGASLRIICIRAWASLRYIKYGIFNFAYNWRVLCLQVSVFDAPELVPGLPKDNHWRSENFYRQVSDDSLSQKLFFHIFFGVLYAPAIMFRLTIKSTAWVYFVLEYIKFTPRKLRTEDGRKIWVGYAGRSKLDVTLFLVALGSLAYLLIQGLNAANLSALKAANAGQPYTPWHLLLAIEPSQYQLWYWVTIPATVLTIVLFFWLDKIRVRLKAGENISENNTQIRMLVGLSQVQSALWYIWILITLLSVALAAWNLGKLPLSMAPVFDWAVIPLTNLWAS